MSNKTKFVPCTYISCPLYLKKCVYFMQHHEPGRNVHAEKEKDEARRVKNDEEKKKDLFRMEINFPFTKRERDDANERIFPIKLNQSGRERFFV